MAKKLPNEIPHHLSAHGNLEVKTREHQILLPILFATKNTTTVKQVI